jgi:hypothetical protein
MESKIGSAKLNIIERRKVGPRWAVTVTGFKKPDPADKTAPKPPELRRVMFYFLGGQLVEVELQYEQDGWDEERYGACLGEKRQMIERLYGQGQQIVRSTAPTPDGNSSQTLVGYKVNKKNTAVELIYRKVSANTGNQTFHTLSLHYKCSYQKAAPLRVIPDEFIISGGDIPKGDRLEKGRKFDD